MKFVDDKLCAFIVPKLIMEMIAKEAKRDTGNFKKYLKFDSSRDLVSLVTLMKTGNDTSNV